MKSLRRVVAQRNYCIVVLVHGLAEGLTVGGKVNNFDD